MQDATRPSLHYIVCATERSGSNLLCETLRRTGVAGRPTEYFSAELITRYQDTWKIQNGFSEYVERVAREASTPNGVCGIKLMWRTAKDLLSTPHSRDSEAFPLAASAFTAVFPNPLFVFIERRDKLRQAVSFAKALQTGVWLKRLGIPSTPEMEPKYNRAEISKLIRVIESHEAAWRSFFESSGIRPLNIVYEDLVESYKSTAINVLKHLGIAPPVNLNFERPFLQKQSDQINERWIARYMSEQPLRERAIFPGAATTS